MAAREFSISRRNAGVGSRVTDSAAIEEPLEIRIEGKTLAVVMRTPGHDNELALGLLFTEGIVSKAGDVFDMTQCPSGGSGSYLDVLLTNAKSFDSTRLPRNLITSSSCGVCSKALLDSLPPKWDLPSGWLDSSTLEMLPAKLRASQSTFEKTGGLHACGLFDEDGNFLASREDVGRHNALDKLIGWALMEKRIPLTKSILILSGRVSYEMMQKSAAARVSAVVALSAPTSLAIEMARHTGQLLIGFLRGASMNIYAGEDQIAN